MSRDPRVYLWDIEKAARSIAAFTAGLDGKGYSESELIHSAVERKFEIIGEALGQLSKQAPELVGRIDGYREIIAFRNVLIHDATIQNDRVWRIAESALPSLRLAVSALLGELDPPAEARTSHD